MLTGAATGQDALPEALADPMQPSGVQQTLPGAMSTPETASALPRLQAIVREGRQIHAIINGQRMGVGDTVEGGATITAVSATSVTLSVGGKTSVLKLVGQEVKRNVRATH